MSVKNSQQLKQLQTRKAKLEVEVKDLEVASREAQSAYSKARNQLNKVTEEIDSLKEKDVIVTEHAILRYLERAMGLNVDQVKDEVLPDNIKAQIAVLGNGKYPIDGGYQIVVKDNAVVSVV